MEQKTMNILYFGTVCDLHTYTQKINYCKARPSVASVAFESALLEGFFENHADIEIHSFPMIPSIPGSKILFFGGKWENLPCGYSCRWLRTVNLPIFKQLSRRMDARRVIKKWVRKNAGEGLILTYSIPPFLVKDIIKYSKRYQFKTVAIIPDLLRDMYINDKSNPVLAYAKNKYLSSALAMQGMYDGYIYLTEAMHDVVAPDKPYIVMEGVASIRNTQFERPELKAKPRAIMYAGMLHEKYGITNLLDAFEMANVSDAELWLFGDGTAVGEIRQRARTNSKIKYFGVVSRSEILEYERKATLLVNPRSPEEEFTKYSFPSKTIEYMLSGTPLLTTKLRGIPSEYFDYVFWTFDNSIQSLSLAISNALSCSDEVLKSIGENAKRFILEEKNANKQAMRILDFLYEVTNEPTIQ